MSPVTKSLAQSALVVSIAVGFSRIFGLVRETVIAHEFGTSSAYDAYIIAFIIPHLLRMLLAEGALSAAFIPLFSEYLKKSKEVAYRFASNVLSVAFIIFPIVIALAMVFAPQYIPFLADGFGEQKLDLTNQLTQITLPFLMLIGISAIFMGIQNSQDRFFAPAFASVFFNIGLIIGALWIAPHVDPPIMGLAVGVLIGGAGQLLFQIPFLRGIFQYKPLLSLNDEGLRRLVMLMLPTVIGLIVVELNVLVDNKLASRLGDGQISAMQYAIRLFQLPLGLFGVAIATALLPRLSRQASDEERTEFVETLKHGLRLGALILFPAAIGLIALGGPVISLLFEHGRFGPEDTELTLFVLRFLAIGLFGYGLGFMLTRGFYALKDTRTPVVISAIAVGINIGLDLLLIGPLGIGGLALATAIAGLVQMSLLAIVLQRKLGEPYLADLLSPVLKALILALIMGAGVLLLDSQMQSISELIRVIVGIVAGALIYGSLTWRAGLLSELLDSIPRLRKLLRRE
jgi:putative peptidoglycan lipid II flippase